MASVKRPVLRYHGGKWRLAPWIIAHFPEHRIYVEPFGGGASVLLTKTPSRVEVYNDLDEEIVNVFRTLQDPTSSGVLLNRLEFTPFSRSEFNKSYHPTDDLTEKAARTIVRSFMGFSSASCTKGHRTGFRAGSRTSGGPPASDWRDYSQHVPIFTKRLKGVLLECRPAIEVILAQDGPDTLFFVDPPYLASTRYAGARYNTCYRHDMTDEDHIRLSEVLLNAQGMVILSGYPSDVYSSLYSDWRMVSHAAWACAGKDKPTLRTECLWLNPKVVDRIQMPLMEVD